MKKYQTNNLWEATRFYFSAMSGVPERIIELKAVFEILRRCALGYTVYRIAQLFGYRFEYVQDVVIEFLGFRGWKYTLDFNPLACYNNSGGSFEKYVSEIHKYSRNITNEKVIGISFILCERFKELEKEILDYERKN